MRSLELVLHSVPTWKDKCDNALLSLCVGRAKKSNVAYCFRHDFLAMSIVLFSGTPQRTEKIVISADEIITLIPHAVPITQSRCVKDA